LNHWGGDVGELRIETIPEPSGLALRGVIGGAVLFVRRKLRRKATFVWIDLKSGA